MNEFNVLLSAATNGTPSGSLFDALFARYIAPQESWRELESPLPITIFSAGEDLIDYRIYGNTENGESVGERMENLFDKEITEGIEDNYYIDRTTGNKVWNTQYFISAPIAVTSGETYCWSFSTPSSWVTHSAPTVVFFDANNNQIGVASHGVNIKFFSFTTPANCTYIRASVYKPDINEAMLTEGSTAPTSYIPYGYQLPMVVRSENLYNYANDTANSYILANGSIANVGSGINYVSEKIPVIAGKTYTLISPLTVMGNGVCAAFYGNDDTALSVINVASTSAPYEKTYTITAPSGALYFRTSIKRAVGAQSVTMFIEGSTAPTEYIPYYHNEENIYIGSDPLAEDEYVDFGEQKIYKLIDGVLTPTDPPVAIPALPTIDGETIIDYNPSETPAVEPEKMYVKYKPQRR